jgi:coenzyme Q-binding protein COQ10
MPSHHEIRDLPYGADEMYALVADVERYPEFLPWTAAARIRSRRKEGDAEVIDADLVISFKVFRERFGSRVTLHPAEKSIDTQYLDGPFKYLKSRWQFAPLDDGGCHVDFFVDFEFKNRVLQGVIGIVFNEAMHRIVRAFEDRARALHGAGASGAEPRR